MGTPSQKEIRIERAKEAVRLLRETQKIDGNIRHIVREGDVVGAFIIGGDGTQSALEVQRICAEVGVTEVCFPYAADLAVREGHLQLTDAVRQAIKDLQVREAITVTIVAGYWVQVHEAGTLAVGFLSPDDDLHTRAAWARTLARDLVCTVAAFLVDGASAVQVKPFHTVEQVLEMARAVSQPQIPDDVPADERDFREACAAALTKVVGVLRAKGPLSEDMRLDVWEKAFVCSCVEGNGSTLTVAYSYRYPPGKYPSR